MNRIPAYMAFIVLVVLSGCGSSGQSSSSSESLSPPGFTNFVEVSIENDVATYYSVNDDASQDVVLMIPLKHFYPDETISLGGDNLYGWNPDEALLLMREFGGDGNQEIKSVLVAKEGSLTLTDAAIRPNGTVAGKISDALLYPGDLQSELIKRDSEGSPFEGGFISYVQVGGDDDPVVRDFSPTSGPIGTEVTLTGFNLDKITGLDFCGGSQPIHEQSEKQLTIEITPKYPCQGDSIASSYGTEIRSSYFQLEFPDTDFVPLEKEIVESVYNFQRDLFFLYSRDTNEILVFSYSDRTFRNPIPLSFSVSAFDVNRSGDRIVLCHLDTHELTLIQYGEGDIVDSNTLTIPEDGLCNDVAFGQGNKALLHTNLNYPSNKTIALLDVDSLSVGFPADLMGGNYYLRFLRNLSSNLIILQDSYGNSTTPIVYQANEDGSFTKGTEKYLSSERVYGINFRGDQIWATQNYYNSQLDLLGTFQDGDLLWNKSSSEGPEAITFTPDDSLVILLSKYNKLDVLDGLTKSPLITQGVVTASVPSYGIPVQYGVSSDSSTLLLLDQNYIYLVDLKSLVTKMEGANP